MEEKLIISAISNLNKNNCDILLHGTIESSLNVHKQIKKNLTACLDLQDKIHSLMEQKGWYKIEQVEESKIEKAKNKYEKSY